MKYELSEDQLYAIGIASRQSICYLRKLRQWREGKIDLTIEGYDPPYMPSMDEIKEEMDMMCQLRDWVDDL